MNTPILLIVFNRSNFFKKLIFILKKVKAKKIYIKIDGPRKNNLNDKKEIDKIIHIIKNINWNCKILINKETKNLGCRDNPVKGINWLFKSENMGIILEDDCMPSLSFFKYCEILLNKYKNCKSISMISGRNNLEKINLDTSYYFNFGSTWGWATWRRAWKFNDPRLKNWKNKKFRERLKKNLKDYSLFYNLLIEKCEKIFKKKINTVWDYQWIFSVISRNMIAVVPKINLVKNIGFDKRSTHTHTKNSQFHSKINSFEIKFPLRHNNDYKINKKLVLQEHAKLYKLSVIVFFKKMLLNFYNKCR
jgi:hypothetical protein